MSIKLSKTEAATLAHARDDILAARHLFETEVEVYNTAVDAAWAKLEDAMSQLNSHIEIASGSVSDIANRLREEFDGKSDAWREGDKGESAESWIAEIEEISNALESGAVELEAPETFEPDPVLEDTLDAIEALSDSPQED